jgi:hypothetical protein
LTRSSITRALAVGLLGVLALWAPGEIEAEPRFEGWREVRTEHFRIIFEPADEAAALEVKGFAEEVYDEVTETLDSYPQTVPVIIRGRTATANGFYAPFPHRINLYVTSPSGPWLGAKHESWLKLLLVHELTHFVQLSDRTGFFGALSHVFGHDVTVLSYPFTPGWYEEGLTTLNETRFTTGGRGRNPFFEMLIKAPVLEGKLWSPDQAAYQSAFAPRGRIYIAGYAMTDYLTRTYGEGTYRRIHREFERRPARGVARAVRKVTGVSYDELYADMHADLIRRFAEDARLPVGTRLSPEEPGNWYLPIATDAGLYAYVDTIELQNGIYRLDIDTDALEAAAAASAGSEPSRRPAAEGGISDDSILEAEMVLPVTPTDPFSIDVSRDGSRIAFTVAGADPGHPARMVSYSDLYLAEGQGSRPRRVTSQARLRHPTLSPDGSRVVAVERQGSYSRLVEVDPQTGALTVLYEPEEAKVLNPRFGPEGERIVFVEHARGFQDIMLYQRGSVEPLLAGAARDRHGDYYPRFADAETVLFSSDRGGRLEVYRYRLDSQALEPVVTDRVAAWSGIPYADGILYGSYTSEGYTLRHATKTARPAGPLAPGVGSGAGVREPAAIGPSGEAALPSASSVPPPPAGREALAESTRYRDVPAPVLWAPYLELYSSTDGDVRLPAGAWLYGAGILQRTSWDAIVAFDGFAVQPRLAFSAGYAPGPVRLGYGFGYRYRAAGSDGYRAELAHRLSAEATPWYRRHPASVSQLMTGLGSTYEAKRKAEGGFSVEETFSVSDVERTVSVTAGASLAHAAFAPPAAYFGGFAAGAGFEASYTPPVLDAEDHEVETFPRLRLRLPAGPGHTLVGLSADAVTSTSGSIGGELLPRSGADWESGDGDAKVLPTVDVRIPLGVYDRPLPGPRPYKAAFYGAGLTVFAQTAFYVDVDEPTGEVEDAFFFGLQAEGSFSLLHLPLSAGAGVAARADWNFSEALGTDDFRFYLFVSTGNIGRTDGTTGPRVIESTDTRPVPHWGRTRSATADSFGP